MSEFVGLWHGWFFGAFLFSTAIICANLIHYLVFRIWRDRQNSRREQRRVHVWDHLSRPARWVFVVTCTLAVLPFLPLKGFIASPLRQALNLLLVAAIGWLCIGCVYVAEESLVRRYDITAEDNVRARRVRTQTQVLRRIAIGLILILDAGAMLWTFHDTQLLHYGTGLVASAGLASLVLAAAAKSTVGNILAGLQIAITEPIRIDDVVIVEGEWGRIEEITTAYVVVRIWDQRRLIVPLSYWIENPFQNWTRETSDLLGTAFLYVDYSVPVAALREHHTKILKATPLWDRQVDSVQVTNCTEHTIEVRCLSSARNSSDQFNLRCLVREEMINFIRQNYPEALPQTRLAALPPALPSDERQFTELKRDDGFRR
jgi:small-conductance mechanosensitive channel